MKFNKWTVGLAAVGAISLASVAQAEEKAMLSSVSSTILSGYVDTSAQWNPGDGDSHAPAYKYGGPSKADGFNLNAVKVSLEKPLDESDWAAGYKVDLFMGPDAANLGTFSTHSGGASAVSDFSIKQAYVALRAPVGNGIDFKVGVFDSIVGYESTEAINNPNFTRSWGHTFEPSTHTGVLSTYRFNNYIAASAGIANTLSPSINSRATYVNSTGATVEQETYKTYMASLALTAPDSWGFLAGSSAYAGFINGWNTAALAPQETYYFGLTLATPITGLRLGASYDYAHLAAKTAVLAPFAIPFGAHSFANYASFQATEKLSLHGRLEYADVSGSLASASQLFGAGTPNGPGLASKVLALTGTVQYDLWKNVLTRVEARWDHALDGTDAFGDTQAARFQGGHIVTGTAQNAFTLAANVIYKF